MSVTKFILTLSIILLASPAYADIGEKSIDLLNTISAPISYVVFIAGAIVAIFLGIISFIITAVAIVSIEAYYAVKEKTDQLYINNFTEINLCFAARDLSIDKNTYLDQFENEYLQETYTFYDDDTVINSNALIIEEYSDTFHDPNKINKFGQFLNISSIEIKSNYDKWYIHKAFRYNNVDYLQMVTRPSGNLKSKKYETSIIRYENAYPHLRYNNFLLKEELPVSSLTELCSNLRKVSIHDLQKNNTRA